MWRPATQHPQKSQRNSAGRHITDCAIEDPPYAPKTRTAKTAYGPYEMTLFQHARLIAALRSHGGPAAISGYRCGDYDRWLKGWRRFDFEMPNNAGQSKRKQRRCESLWINW